MKTISVHISAAVAKKIGKRISIKFLIYLILWSLGFVFIYPVLYMLSTSVMGQTDIISPYVVLIPFEFNFYNYYLAAIAVHFKDGIISSLIIGLGGAIGQTISCAIIGYGFGRYKFPGKNIMFILLIFTFIVPPEVIVIPLYIQFAQYKLLGTFLPFIIPAFLGQGLKGAIFIIIYQNFFSALPWELEDSARIDGLKGFGIFTRIMLPLSTAAVIVVFVFSFVWNWNDYFIPSIFLRPQLAPLSVRLSNLWHDIREYLAVKDSDGELIKDWGRNPYLLAISNRSEGMGMAACVLVVFIPFVMYVIMQRFFTEGIERTGLVE